MDLTGMERGSLRQGDILRQVAFPLLASDSLRIIGKADPSSGNLPYPSIVPALTPHRNDPNYFTGMVQMRMAFAAVISQCCELEPRNGKLIGSAFSLARLVSIKESIMLDSDKLTSLKSNPDPRAGTRGFLDYFYVDSNPLLDTKDWMVDFSQVVSLPKSEFPGVLERKILQLDDCTRAKFKIKLAAYFGRLTDEELRDGLEDPWTTVH